VYVQRDSLLSDSDKNDDRVSKLPDEFLVDIYGSNVLLLKRAAESIPGARRSTFPASNNSSWRSYSSGNGLHVPQLINVLCSRIGKNS
jgi:hypothetical protein